MSRSRLVEYTRDRLTRLEWHKYPVNLARSWDTWSICYRKLRQGFLICYLLCWQIHHHHPTSDYYRSIRETVSFVCQRRTDCELRLSWSWREGDTERDASWFCQPVGTNKSIQLPFIGLSNQVNNPPFLVMIEKLERYRHINNTFVRSYTMRHKNLSSQRITSEQFGVLDEAIYIWARKCLKLRKLVALLKWNDARKIEHKDCSKIGSEKSA